jgi:hypothetical protein
MIRPQALALAALYLLINHTAARADIEESAAAFFEKDRTYWQKGQQAPDTVPTTTARRERAGTVSPDRQAVIDSLAKATRAKLGERYVDDVLRLAKLESGYRCNVRGPQTRVGRAVGPLQIMPGSARALGITNLSTCSAQIEAGLRHVEKCVAAGATTYKALAACHVSGWHGWNRRLAGKHETYKQKYVRMAMAVPSQRRFVRS